MNSKIDKILKIITVLVWLGLIFEGIYIYSNWPRENKPPKVESISEKKSTEEKPTNETTKNSKEAEVVLSESMTLDIPFITQAPFMSWKEYPFNHTCEEASVLQVYYYFEKKKPNDEAKIRQELLDLVDFEIKNYGFHEDTSASQTAKLIEDYYGYKTKVSYDISLNDIKKEVSQGRPVILPTAGRLLHNPHFTGLGPLYHMIVVKGYNKEGFIVNDGGTYRTGANWLYSYDTIEKAVHDWNNGDVLNGKKTMIVVYPPEKSL